MGEASHSSCLDFLILPLLIQVVVLIEPEENLEIMKSHSSSVTKMGKTEAQSKDMPQSKLREMTSRDGWGS